MTRRWTLAAGAALLALAGCSRPEFAAEEQYGASPRLPDPTQYLFPPMGVSKPVGWAGNATPRVPQGYRIAAFAKGLANPRNILPLPNGDVLVVEAGGPGIEPVDRPKDIAYNLIMGSSHGNTEPGNRVILFRDTDRDGVADQKTVLIDKLNSPFGIAMVANTLYVAETNALRAWPYTVGQSEVGPGRLVTELPGGPIDHHWTKALVASPDGSRLYVGVGSNSNIVENGLEAEKGRAAIWEVDPARGLKRLYATGLRNPNGLTFEPGTGRLWTVVNERDELGNNLVPDYMTSVQDGGFYGWPYSYWGQNVDVRVQPQRPDLVQRAIVPDYSLSSHVAPLGMAFSPGGAFPAGAFVGEHGSWDRTVYNGYQVVFVPFTGGRPDGKAQPFLTGFIEPDGTTHGRPVGVAFDTSGALLVADDVGNTVWRVTRG